MGYHYILICIGLPLLGAFLLPLIGKFSPRVRNLAALIMVLLTFSSAAACLPAALDGAPYSFTLNLPMGFDCMLVADALACFMAMASSFIAAIIIFYSFGYIEHYANQNEYYMMVTLFIGAMMGLVHSSNLLFIYIFWEICAVCCWRLIGFFRGDSIIRRANKALLITVGGATLMLLGFIILYAETGTLNLHDMQGASLSTAVIILILCGILSESATLPFHCWLPDAGVAPSPVTSMLHAAILVKIGLFVFVRIFVQTFAVDAIWETIIPVIAAVSALVSAGAAIVETDIKRIIAYSTISQLAFILLGLSTGSALGIAGGLLYILMHGLAKAGLFLCAGVVEHSVHTKDIRQMGGLYKSMPITAVCFAMCAFSVMGLPPFGGFFAKYMVINGAVEANSPWIAAVFLFGAVLTIIYLLRVFIQVFFGEPKCELVKEGSWEMLTSIVLFAALSVLAGIFINIPSEIVSFIVAGLGV